MRIGGVQSAPGVAVDESGTESEVRAVDKKNVAREWVFGVGAYGKPEGWERYKYDCAVQQMAIDDAYLYVGGHEDKVEAKGKTTTNKRIMVLDKTDGRQVRTLVRQ